MGDGRARDAAAPEPPAAPEGDAEVDAEQGLLRLSCLRCYASRKRCETPGAPAECARCHRLGVECVYLQRRKPGPKPGSVRKKPGRRGRRSGSKKVQADEPDAASDDDWVEETNKNNDSSGPRTEIRSEGSAARRRSDIPHLLQPLASIEGFGTATTLAGHPNFNFGASVEEATRHEDEDGRFSALVPEDAGYLYLDESNGSATSASLEDKDPTSPLQPLALYPALPDNDVVNLVIGRVIGPLFMSMPVAVRTELRADLTSNRLQDFQVASLLFFGLWYDKSLPDLIGPAVHTDLLQTSYARFQSTILAPLELVIAGHDALFGPDTSDFQDSYGADLSIRLQRKLEFKSLAVTVLQSLIYVLAVALNFKTSTADPFSDLDSLIRLAVFAAKASKLNIERIYHTPHELASIGIPPLVEAARRCWWTLALIDRQVAVMYDRDTIIKMEECMEIGLHVAEGEFEERKRIASLGAAGPPPPGPGPPAEAVPKTPSAAAQPSPGKEAGLGHIYAFSAASAEMVATLVAARTPSLRRPAPSQIAPENAGPTIVQDDRDAGINEVLAVALPRQPVHPQLRPASRFDPVKNYVRLVSAIERTTEHRRSSPLPYWNPGDRTEINAELDSLFDSLPSAIRDLDLMSLRAPQTDSTASDRSSADVRHVLLNVIYFLLMWHTAKVLLASPSEESIWSGHVDVEWLSTPAFLEAQEHAIRATGLLRGVLSAGSKIEQLSAPVGCLSSSCAL